MSKTKTEVKLIELNGRTLSQRTSFHENGVLAQKGTYGSSQNGWEWNVPIGIVEKYFDNGQLECRLTYNSSGNLDGESVFYSRRGTLLKKIVYANDIVIEKAEFEETFKEEKVLNKKSW